MQAKTAHVFLFIAPSRFVAAPLLESEAFNVAK
jgi:hypothetical protein